MQQPSLQPERKHHESPVREVERLANEYYYRSLKLLLRQNDKKSIDLTLLNEMEVLLGSKSHQEGNADLALSEGRLDSGALEQFLSVTGVIQLSST